MTLSEPLESRTLLAANPVVLENQRPGNPQSEWDVSGVGDLNILGYSTDISVNVGQTVDFKIDDKLSAPYRLDIYRMGYYGGLGARKVATVPSTQTLKVVQPAPLTNATTGLVDAGNWSVSASWAVPADATSGMYFARVVREDTGGATRIVFIVRNDNSHSDLLFQTSDSTWEAYNDFGGQSLYEGNSTAAAGRAVKVSYNRPLTLDDRGGGFGTYSSPFNDEYATVRFLERSGYDVSYFTSVDSERFGSEILEHKAFLSVGHDEYWSAGMRVNVEAARDAGVNLAFFSGNEVFWKTRWENSTDASGAPYRTLVCYKESKANAKIDPSPVWTGTWRDDRFVAPPDAGRPENSLTGTLYMSDRTNVDSGISMQVPAEFSGLRFWRDTAVAALQPGQVATLGDRVVGYEVDEDLDNGFRPAGLARMSATTYNTLEHVIVPWGTQTGAGVSTHSITLYRAPSGALVFGAGTIQWSYGLDGVHLNGNSTPDRSMQQATVNLLADMGAQPGTLQPDLVRQAKSTDLIGPSTAFTSPAVGATLTAGTPVMITGTATDTGGGTVASVEVSTDGGRTWHPATGRGNWTYTWTPLIPGPVRLLSRAADDSANLSPTSSSVDVTIGLAPTSTAGLVAAYNFDAGSGTTLANLAGAGNTGTISGATWTTQGRFGNALSFDGVNDWVTVPDSASLDLTTGMTLEAWVRPGNINNYTTVIIKEAPTDLAYTLYASDGANAPPVVWISNGLDYSAPAPTNIVLNTWTHLAATYSGSLLSMYVNGTLVRTEPTNGNPLVTTNGALRIGGNSIWGEYFQGLIDEVRIYNRAISASEVLSDLSTPVGGVLESTAPTVSITVPAGGASVANVVNVTASATDNLLVAGVQFMLNGEPLGAEDLVAPYTVAWDTRKYANGTYVLSSRARDAAGNATTSSDVTVTVANPADVTVPRVTLNNPWPADTVSGTTVLWAVAGDNIGITGVQFKVNGVNVGPLLTSAPYRLLWDANAAGSGPATVTAVAFDAAGNSTPASASVTVDATPPVVIGFTPADGSTGVSPSLRPTVTFSEAVDPASTRFVVLDGASNAIAGTLTYEETTRTVTFIPAASLALGTTYSVTVDSTRDVFGNAMTGAVNWSFSTDASVPRATLWPDTVVPATPATTDAAAVELGVRFTSDIAGYVTGVRFYKGAGNTGTHVGHLWTASGTLLAAATFAGETATGWQEVSFASPIAIAAHTTYVASYYAPAGHYPVDASYFVSPRNSAPLHGTDGVFVYSSGGGFPINTFNNNNYWADVVFSTNGSVTDTTPPTVTSNTPAANATNVARNTAPTAVFSEAIQPATLSFVLRNSAGAAIAATVGYDGATRTATLTPSVALDGETVFTATVSNAQDLAGNALAAPFTWSFTTAPATDTIPPTITGRTPAPGSTALSRSVNATVTFSEAIQFSTLSFVLTDPLGNPVPATVTYNAATYTATLAPNALLAGETTYTATVNAVQDLSGNALAAPSTWSFTTGVATAPTIEGATIWDASATPATPSVSEALTIELGVKFRVDYDGYITGLRFYKGPSNTGTHVGRLWTAGGTLLASATFANETATGWQEVKFAAPVPVSAATTYVASYFAPAGGFAVSPTYFATAGVDNGAMHALSNASSGGNGLFLYGGGFPTQTFNSTNYWVDVTYSTVVDTVGPTVIGQTPVPAATGVPSSSAVTVTFSEPVQPATISFVLKDSDGYVVPAAVSYDAATRTATLTPSSPLFGPVTYTATVSGAKDTAGNAMSGTISWSFATVAVAVPAIEDATIWAPSVTPAVPSAGDGSSLELGVKFRVEYDGYLTGVRFYKGAGNSGTHVGHLWTSSGTVLATATFTNETASGWQEVRFASPVPVTRGAVYVASYYAPNGGYAVTGGYFAAGGVDNGALHALPNSLGGNGVFTTGTGFPNQTFNSTNYWVDVTYSTVIDTAGPTVTGQTPAPGATGVPSGSAVTVTFSEPVQSGTISFVLTDSNGYVVPATVSYDAASRTSTLTPSSPLFGPVTYTATVSGAKDLSNNAMTGAASWSFTTVAVAVPAIEGATIWDGSATPAVSSVSEGTAVELGVRFRADYDGYITGLRFYKGTGNTGTHVGHLWTSTGSLLATATFTSESASGWQNVSFATPLAITRGAIYVASYFAPNGGYAVTGGYFATGGTDSGALHALPNSFGGNGVFTIGTGFPNQTFNSSNYWVDVTYNTVIDTVAPTVTTRTPASGATGVPVGTTVTATFSEAVRPESITFILRDSGGTDVPATVSYDAATRVATLTVSGSLSGLSTYTATVSGVRDSFGNPMAADVTWSFTTADVPAPTIEGATLWDASATPANASASDTSSVELGVKFRADYNGFITGIRFYKGSGNAGTHTGHLWTSTGTLLAAATFTNETATGWQQVSFSSPVAISAGTTYVASYLAPSGGYAYTSAYFATAGVNSGALHAPSNGAAGGNGVFRYGGTSQFPNSSFNSTNYWIDVVYSTVVDSINPTITDKTPAAGATGLPSTAVATATFSEPVQPGTISFVLRDDLNNNVPAAVSYDAATRTATLTPTSVLSPGTTYTASVLAALDMTGNPLAASVSWTFTTGNTSVKQTTAADFLAGTWSGVEATNNAGGEVQLASVVALTEDFLGAAVPADWTTTSWVPQGGGPFAVDVAGGVLSVAGGQVLSADAYPNKPLEGLVSFGAAGYQHFGLATTFASVSAQYWAMFSTMGTTDTLFARVNNNGSTVDVAIGARLSGFHLYKVQPVTGGFQFYVDNVLKTTINSTFAAGTQLRVAISAFAGAPQPALQVEWVKVSSYGSSGTFESSILDAGSSVQWGLIDWTTTVPPGTSILVETRTGDVANPDGTWSGWTAATDGGTIGSPNGRYIQYRVTFTGNGGAATSVLEDILLAWT